MKFLLFGGVVLFLLFFVFSSQKITGESISYTGNKMQIYLLEGELIPASVNVIFEKNDSVSEYLLSELIYGVSTEGKYYIASSEILGEGMGYGIQGKKIIYPEINFALKSVFTEEEIKIEENNSKIIIEENPEESFVNESVNKTVFEVNDTIKDDKNITEDLNNESAEQTELEDKINKNYVQEENSSIITQEENVVISEETNQEVEIIQENSEESQIESAPITGGVIKKILNSISKFFLGLLKLTANVISEKESVINATVSAESPFVYTPKLGESVSLVKDSLSYQGQKLDDNLLKIDFIDGKFIISTNYSMQKQGFGETYLGQEIILELNLSKVNQDIDGSNVKLVYGNTDLSFVLNSRISNRTIQKNFIEDYSEIFSLTDDEKKFLAEKLGDASINVIKSEIFNGRYILGYSLGDYAIEFSYDPLLDEKTLNLQMTSDRIKWERNIINSLSQKEKVHKEFKNISSEFFL